MVDFLSEIIELKKVRLKQAQSLIDFETLYKRAQDTRLKSENFRLRQALESKSINIIAEFKRASPSKGVINNRLDVAQTVLAYENGNACAISVLTEEDRFGGSLSDLKTARNATSLPILRKDFIFDEYQIIEAAAAGADAILLIVAMLDKEKLRYLHEFAHNLGLDVLVEIHTADELQIAARLGAKIIGINNRDLHTFKVSLDVSRRLIQNAPTDAFIICESGLSNPEQIKEMHRLGFSGFLIGEILMRSVNIVDELKKLTFEDTKRAEFAE